MRIDIYSDTACPWCLLGKRRFESALALRPQYGARLFWRPFELNPDLPVDGLDRAWFIATRVADTEWFAQNEILLTDQGKAAGVEYRFDLIRRLPNTRRSHLLIAHAAALGLTGVPAVVFDGEYTLSGAQGTDALVRAIDLVAEMAAARER